MEVEKGRRRSVGWKEDERGCLRRTGKQLFETIQRAQYDRGFIVV